MSELTVPQPPNDDQAPKRWSGAVARKVLLVLALIGASALVVAAVADWNVSVAKAVAGVLVAALAVLFLAEVAD